MVAEYTAITPIHCRYTTHFYIPILKNVNNFCNVTRTLLISLTNNLWCGNPLLKPMNNKSCTKSCSEELKTVSDEASQ